MSYGFSSHPKFAIVGAADAQLAKPSMQTSGYSCNETYQSNIGVLPQTTDLRVTSPKSLRIAWGVSGSLDVLTACPPCTGFSRANPINHIEDDSRNSLVVKCIDFIAEFEPKIFIMENARELIQGNHKHHLKSLQNSLLNLGYRVSAQVHNLNDFGLPQKRERAVVIASRAEGPLPQLERLWEKRKIDPVALNVSRALSVASASAGDKRFPRIRDEGVADRIRNIPRDGGSWIDLAKSQESTKYLTPSMRRIIAAGKLGSYPDVYGRMRCDLPAPTIKRECAHVGNGRYCHPFEDRLLSIQEMALIQGFPSNYTFHGRSLANCYRQIGDAVPPLISAQLAELCAASLENKPADMQRAILSNTTLSISDISGGAQAIAA